MADRSTLAALPVPSPAECPSLRDPHRAAQTGGSANQIDLQRPRQAEAERLLKQSVEIWTKEAAKLALWAEENLPMGFAVFDFPEGHRTKLRTTNGLERINRELKRRTRVASIFPNAASCLRLVSALLAECDEVWMSGKMYLNLKG